MRRTARTLLTYNFKSKICKAINKTITKKSIWKIFLTNTSFGNQSSTKWIFEVHYLLIFQTYTNHFITYKGKMSRKKTCGEVWFTGKLQVIFCISFSGFISSSFLCTDDGIKSEKLTQNIFWILSFCLQVIWWWIYQ